MFPILDMLRPLPARLQNLFTTWRLIPIITGHFRRTTLYCRWIVLLICYSPVGIAKQGGFDARNANRNTPISALLFHTPWMDSFGYLFASSSFASRCGHRVCRSPSAWVAVARPDVAFLSQVNIIAIYLKQSSLPVDSVSQFGPKE
jgi:hypothetical protein